VFIHHYNAHRARTKLSTDLASRLTRCTHRICFCHPSLRANSERMLSFIHSQNPLIVGYSPKLYTISRFTKNGRAAECATTVQHRTATRGAGSSAIHTATGIPARVSKPERQGSVVALARNAAEGQFCASKSSTINCSQLTAATSAALVARARCISSPARKM
jgi:hypothetical protein